MGSFSQECQFLVWQEGQQKVWLQPWGVNGLRVQANLGGERLSLPQALLEPAAPVQAAIELGEAAAVIRNGSMCAKIARDGRLEFSHAPSGRVLVREPDWAACNEPNRNYKYRGGRLYQIEATFEAQDGERFFGLGQHPDGRLDQKGCVVELKQRNTAVSIPFLVSNRLYGFLWNNPSVGRVELGCNATRWVAEGSQQLDYYVVCGESYPEILERYADATGHAPMLPEWAAGFWQSKLRYETQEELLAVAREYKRRGLPLAVIVADFFHWSHMGDWRFDPACWPDPRAMVRELEEMGVRLMVSIWPTVSPLSENYSALRERGLLIHNEFGTDAQQVFVDHGVGGPAYYPYYDATHPEARKFIWETVKKNYYDLGVKMFWLDNDEPDVNPWNPGNLRFHLGNGVEVANIYPLLHQKAFYDGMRAAGETEFVTLSRSGWAGSQRFSSAIWSGDIASTFEALRAQVRAGLNIGMSGIPWWSTDIGGFHGGDVRSSTFRELIVRWFQYGVFCPIFRLHGYRLPTENPMPATGAGNEVWSFGEEAYGIIRELLFLRERLRPYLQRQMKLAAEKGLPPMRPLFVDFPADPVCETVEDQFLLGPDVLVAPVLAEGARERKVYLPAGTDWTDAQKGTSHPGGQWLVADAPLESVPVFLKAGSGLEGIFRQTG
jgi:alpha-D-xyloside xylohydrolase